MANTATAPSTSTHSDNGYAKEQGTHANRPARRLSTETKSALKTTEFFAYLAAVIGVLVASAVVDVTDFGAQEAWFYVSLLTIGYMVSRGLAKSGSRDFFDADR